VDPDVYPVQPGVAPDSRKSEDTTNYLRRLKDAAEQDMRSAPATGASPGPATASNAPVTVERRRSPRLTCTGSAEFRAEGSDVRMWGTLQDVSLHGCYVEMNATFPAGTRVSLALEALGIRVQVQGSVRVSYPFLGMGICFTEIEPGEQQHLEQLLAALARQNAPPNPEQTRDSGLQDVLVTADPKAVLDGIRQFFESKRLLSRDEFCQIAKQARRF
jgi:PilZ domain